MVCTPPITHERKRVMMRLLDVLQSVPIFSFLAHETGGGAGFDRAHFYSQAWHPVFSMFQSARTIPGERVEAVAVFRFGR